MSKLLWKLLLAAPTALAAALAFLGFAVAAEAASMEEFISVSSLEQVAPEELTSVDTPGQVALQEFSRVDDLEPASLDQEPTRLAQVASTNVDTIQQVSLQEFSRVDGLEPASLDQEPAQLAQVTSVQQLSDVNPSHWAFQALQNLVNRYNCIQGYPGRTFRGDRSLTRYEFAAGLNACLDVIAQVAQTDAISGSEFEQIRRLQEEFQLELNTLRGRVDALEVDVAELEANQFSTTTKLRGRTDVILGAPFDTIDTPTVEDSPSFVSRALLNFDTSFTGKDRLRVRLQGSTGGGGLDAFGGYAANPGAGDSTLDLRINDFYYSFPVGNRLDFIIAANSILTDDFVVSTIVPFDGPSVADAGGPQFYDVGMGGGAGVGASFSITERFVLDVGYSVNPTGAADPSVGIFQGTEGIGASQSYIAQLSYLGKNLQAGAAYLHGDGGLEFESATGKAVDTFAGLVNFSFGRFNIGGHIALADFDGGNDFSWTAGVAVDDVFMDGAKLGVYGGQLPQFEGRDDNPFLVEGYYEIPFNEHLTITPAIVYGDAGVGGAGDDTTIYGLIRTTFRF